LGNKIGITSKHNLSAAIVAIALKMAGTPQRRKRIGKEVMRLGMMKLSIFAGAGGRIIPSKLGLFPGALSRNYLPRLARNEYYVDSHADLQ